MTLLRVFLAFPFILLACLFEWLGTRTLGSSKKVFAASVYYFESGTPGRYSFTTGPSPRWFDDIDQAMAAYRYEIHRATEQEHERMRPQV